MSWTSARSGDGCKIDGKVSLFASAHLSLSEPWSRRGLRPQLLDRFCTWLISALKMWTCRNHAQNIDSKIANSGGMASERRRKIIAQRLAFVVTLAIDHNRLPFIKVEGIVRICVLKTPEHSCWKPSPLWILDGCGLAPYRLQRSVHGRRYGWIKTANRRITR